MFFISNQVSTLNNPNFEQALSKYSTLTQSINEEFDRINALHGHAVRQFFETSSSSLLESLSLKDPQDFFLQGSNQLQVAYQQASQYLQTISNIGQEAQGKFLQLFSDLSPIKIDTIIDVTPDAPIVSKVAVVVDVQEVAPRVTRTRSARKEDVEAVDTIDVTPLEVITKSTAEPKAKPIAQTKVKATAKLTKEDGAKPFFPTAPKKSALTAVKAKPRAASTAKKASTAK